ncbi:hypothetical protein ACHAXA_007502 [Cyclostephanos tholiformis]|uniref:Uncharacterized protein n=1 Tax=Cyclostephanos tholiformis TaxID=382380 RepID=A0ABD3RER6_9STRA
MAAGIADPRNGPPGRCRSSAIFDRNNATKRGGSDDSEKSNNNSENDREDSTSVDDGTSTQSIRERMRLMKERQEGLEKCRKIEEKKKKQRVLYLKRKALEEEEDEMRKKDAELGPGWKYRGGPERRDGG